MYVPPILKYTAYAIALGYRVAMPAQQEPDPEAHPDAFHFRDIVIWDTANGWRVAKWLPDGAGKFAPVSERHDFFKTLPKALREGLVRARPANDSDYGPLLPHLRAVLREMQDGNGAGNPYCKDSVIEALRAIKNLTGFYGDYSEANERK